MASARDVKALGLIGLECTPGHEIVVSMILPNTHSTITPCVYGTFVTIIAQEPRFIQQQDACLFQ